MDGNPTLTEAAIELEADVKRQKPPKTIELENVGPVKSIKAALAGPGGALVFKGRNGCGKSHALEAIDSALSGDGKLPLRDGAAKGHVRAFGIDISVGRSTRQTGTLEVSSISGRLDISELVDPGIKSLEAADALRIKRLVQLSGTKADPALFYDLVGGKDVFEKLVKPRPDVDDVVALAAGIKRDLETTARAVEGQADTQAGKADALRQQAEGVDLTLPSDSVALQSELTRRTLDEQKLRQDGDNAIAWNAKLDQAARELEAAKANYSGPTLEAATQTSTDARRNERQKLEALETARAAFMAAKDAHVAAQSELAHCQQIELLARAHEQSMAAWQTSAAGDRQPEPSPEQLAEAAAAVNKARAAVETGVTVRKAKEATELAEQAKQAAADLRKRAERLRKAAGQTDDVLTGIVAASGCPLRIIDGRLVLKTDRREEEYFADLSDGERCKLAIDLALPAAGANAVIVAQQWIWEALDGVNRRDIINHAAKRGAWLITAEATEDEDLIAEVHSGNSPAVS